ncbi:aldose 1-epimerase family protein (plasmid) [Phyllobacterium sp. 628]|uniref:aldose 1-epimerase family protein n=1 Tax=Phyllobacterium sp. 628 TaxID=2718938 RepID=UPI0016626973|nr:aldose 1-epimerase family protein [Phyllobacterium sp. 628]QND54733.1 aldose 1-epimerase family protein [Phyllobacterium sp. 628]
MYSFVQTPFIIGTFICVIGTMPSAFAAGEHKQILLDVANDKFTPAWEVSHKEWGGEKWSVKLRSLHGGKQEGVQVIDVDNGVMTFTIVPTRGFGVWKAKVGDLRLGWDSPVTEIVSPAFIDLNNRGGLGWLDGFGGWMVRAGIASVGAPGMDGVPLNLHGNIDHTPASYVDVRYEGGKEPKLVFKGVVNDTQMFGPNLQLKAEISTPIGKPEITFDDTITNLSDAPQEFESLYHTNFGPPLLVAGAEFIAAVSKVSPRDARALEGDLVDWNKYTGPHQPGYTEQVYLMELQGDKNGNTSTMLKSADGTKAAVMDFNIKELPAFSLWKNEAPSRTGYVTGLEPATNFPYPRPVERSAGRLNVLRGGESHHATLVVRALTSKTEVTAAAEAIAKLQKSEPAVLKTPLNEQK